MPSPCHFLISGQLLRTSDNSFSFSISLQGSSVLHSAQTLERYRVSGHAVLDEDDQDRAENVTRFFLLSPSESSVFQVCTEKITVYRINLLKVQKTGS